jgi:site-specific DNA recombinase
MTPARLSGTTMTVRRNTTGTPVYRCRKGGHCSWPAERTDRFVENVIVARLSREDVAGLIPHEAEVDVAALRDELVVCDARKHGAAQLYARGGIDEAQLETITAELDHRMAEIRAGLNAATAHSPLSPFAMTDDARRTWEELPIGRKREIARILLAVTLPPLGRGHTFNRDLIRISGATAPARAA